MPGLIPLRETHESTKPWEESSPKPLSLAQRVKRFLSRPNRQKYAVVARHLHRWIPIVTVPVPLPHRGWWLARNDHMSQRIIDGKFETTEISFVRRFLQPGMTVLDIGAHNGFYTLVASQAVGTAGHVYSFEPSPRERAALLKHLRLNRCANVTPQDFALGEENTESNLYVANGRATGCNSLKPPVVKYQTSPTPVRVRRLDDWLNEQKLDRVDFIKLDVEGGELGVLKGAKHLLERQPRPTILVEVQDIRTEPWGYKARVIIEHLVQKGYKWFGLLESGSPTDLDIDQASFDGNFVACPEESEIAFRQSNFFARHGLSDIEEP